MSGNTFTYGMYSFIRLYQKSLKHHYLVMIGGLMTVQELREKLTDMPDDAIVMLRHALVGDEHQAETVIYKEDDYHDKRHGVVWIMDCY